MLQVIIIIQIVCIIKDNDHNGKLIVSWKFFLEIMSVCVCEGYDLTRSKAMSFLSFAAIYFLVYYVHAESS